MTQQYAGTPPPGADTPPPVDERPPYGAPSRWPLIVFVGIVVAALVAAGTVAYYTIRAVWRLAVGGPTPKQERVIMFAEPDQSYAGATYRAEFYDDNFRQLNDRELWVALPALHGPAADAALDQFARQCAETVESLDSQRCFKPRLVVFGVDGRRVREWRVAR